LFINSKPKFKIMLIIKRSSFMKFFDPNKGDEGAGAGAGLEGSEDIYGAADNEGVPDNIKADMGDSSGEGGELTDTDIQVTDDNNQTKDGTQDDQTGDDSPTDDSSASGDKEIVGSEDKTAKLLESLVDRLAPQPQSAPAVMTAEDRAAQEKAIRDFVKPVQVTKEKLSAVGFEDPTDEQVNALQTILQDGVTNSVRVAQLAIEQALGPIRNQMEVMGHYVSSQQEADAVEGFYSQQEDLKPYSRFVDMVSKEVASDAEWVRGKSYDDVVKRISTDTRALLKEAGIKITGQTENARANLSADSKGGSGVPAMQTLGGSGRSSGRGSGGGNGQVDPDADIYVT
jgi:hypothetical protein